MNGPVVRRQALSIDTCSTAARHVVIHPHCLCRTHSMAEHTSRELPPARQLCLLASINTQPHGTRKAHLLWPGFPSRPAYSGLMPGSPAVPAEKSQQQKQWRQEDPSSNRCLTQGQRRQGNDRSAAPALLRMHLQPLHPQQHPHPPGRWQGRLGCCCCAASDAIPPSCHPAGTPAHPTVSTQQTSGAGHARAPCNLWPPLPLSERLSAP